jgi:glutaredoxin
LVEVTLYGRPDCHLCDEARAAILAFDGVELREIDIGSDDELFRAMLERIPVVEVAGRVVSELEFDAEEFSVALHTLSP